MALRKILSAAFGFLILMSSHQSASADKWGIGKKFGLPGAGNSIDDSVKEIGKSIEKGAQDSGSAIDKAIRDAEQSPSDPCKINNRLPQCSELGGGEQRQ